MKTTEKLNIDSPDIQSQSPIARNVERLAALKELFPSAVSEGKVNFDTLRQLLGDDIAKDDELFGLQWHGKTRARRNALTPSLGTLRPCKEESKNWDSTKNLYIEGDNLEVLKLLQKSYAGKVKMIYIDPPYNTGKEFVYPDDYQNGIQNYLNLTGQQDKFKANAETSGRYHTDWLNMMYPRLMLARELLSDDGVIFISIDDHEYANLANVCDEIFGKENCLGPIIQDKRNSKADTLNIQRNHEFILVYASKSTYSNGYPLLYTNTIKPKEIIIENDNYYYLNDPITTRGEGGTLTARPNLGYSIYFNPVTNDLQALFDYDKKLINTNDEDIVYQTNLDLVNQGYIPIRPPKVRGILGCWTWDINKFNKDKKSIIAVPTKNGYQIRKRTFVDKTSVYQKDNILYCNAHTKSNIKSILEYSTNEGSISLTNTLGHSNILNNPKNESMIRFFANILNDSDALILDFFSGSATTAHAVMQLNAEDGGNRKFIMVQLPEPCVEGSEAAKAGYKNICEIGKERIRRAGEKVKEEAGLAGQTLDIGFRVFKLDSSNVKPWNTEPGMLNLQLESESNLRPERTSEDIFYEVLLKQGIELTEDSRHDEIAGHTVYSLGHGLYYCCFDEQIGAEAQELAAGIARWHEKEAPDDKDCVVYVRDSAFMGNEDERDAAKKSFCLTLEQSGILKVKAF